jgi:hypothetical protein
MKTLPDYETHEGNGVYMKAEGNLLLEVRIPPLLGRSGENLPQGCGGSTE